MVDLVFELNQMMRLYALLKYGKINHTIIINCINFNDEFRIHCEQAGGQVALYA